MATNLRLRPETEQALRAEAERTGRSQQDIMREAIDVRLGIASSSIDALYASGALRRPREPYREAIEKLVLPEGVTSLDLLDREDRF